MKLINLHVMLRTVPPLLRIAFMTCTATTFRVFVQYLEAAEVFFSLVVISCSRFSTQFSRSYFFFSFGAT